MTVYGFEQDVARDILRKTYGPDTDQAQTRRDPFSRASGVWIMEATTAITAATTTTPGTGTAKLKWRNTNTGTFEDWKPNGVIVERTVYTMTTPLPSGWLFMGEMDNFGTIYLNKVLNATRYEGLINDSGGFAEGDSTTAMDNLTAINGLAVETSLGTVANTMGWPGDDNAIARAFYNFTDAEWQLEMVACQ